MTEAHDWITLHRVRFNSAIDGTDLPIAGPANAEAWRFYPASPIGENGVRTSISDEWGGIGIYADRASAEAVFAAPESYLPFLGQTVEAWHALLLPVTHRGDVNWRGSVQSGSTVKVASDDPGGPLAVLTSAGYSDPGPEDIPRIRTFLAGVERVRDFYATLPGNVRRTVFSGAGVDGHDGLTVSLWQDDGAMLAAAYSDGVHREQMDAHRKSAMFDRSSFTRARILSSKGAWDGTDPVAQMA